MKIDGLSNTAAGIEPAHPGHDPDRIRVCLKHLPWKHDCGRQRMEYQPVNLTQEERIPGI